MRRVQLDSAGRGARVESGGISIALAHCMTTCFVRCTLDDAPELLRLAQEALATDSFYRTAFGFDDADFDRYWRAYFRLVLEDPGADVFAISDGGRLVACGALGHYGFPSATLRDRFRAELSSALEPERWAKLERFLDAYDAVMAIPEVDARREAQVLWALIIPSKRKLGYLGEALQWWTNETRRDTVEVIAGFVNASAERLVSNYLGYGAQISPLHSWGEERLARVWLELGPAPSKSAERSAA